MLKSYKGILMSYLNKLNSLDQQLEINEVHQQVAEINEINHIIQEHKILSKAPQPLGFAPDLLEELTQKTSKNERPALIVINNLLNNFRQYLSLTYGIWSLPNLETANLIKKELQVKTALEIMAGNGYWSKALEKVGIKTVTTDSLEWAKTSATGSKKFVNVEDLNAVDAIKKYHNLDLILCSWSPNFGKSDLEVVKTWKKYSQAHLIFIGEKNGATNSREFWDYNRFVKSHSLKRINQSFKSYDFIEEKIFEVEKNELEEN